MFHRKKVLGSDRQCNDKSNMDLHKHITKFKFSTCQIFQWKYSVPERFLFAYGFETTEEILF